jgi:two-component system, NtrC family, response regulator HydG
MHQKNADEPYHLGADAAGHGADPEGGRETRLMILAIDDDPSVLAFYEASLSSNTVRITTATDPLQGVELAATLSPDLILLDLTMPGIDGVEALRRIRCHDPEARVVMITGDYSIESAVKAIQDGATDYVCKPVSRQKMLKVLQETREHVELRRRESTLEEQLTEVFSLEGMIGRSPCMLEVFDLVRRVAPHFRTALITGETGTGKELVARALHKLSPRSQQRIAVFNCSALVDTLAESQLFGHRKGAFTGAICDQEGIFEWANGGTVFLDEVGDLSPPVQSKLLRVLENGEVQKLGLPRPLHVDVQLIAATSRDLKLEMKSNRFRPDLWYRLNMVQIRLPPLRERREDILLLARKFVVDFATRYHKEIHKISRRVESALMEYSWPGNVRELENVIGRACMLTGSRMLNLEDLPEEVRAPSPVAGGPASTLEEAEKQTVLRILGEAQNKAQAARRLGVTRARLYRLMEKYGLAEALPDEDESNEAAGNA